MSNHAVIIDAANVAQARSHREDATPEALSRRHILLSELRSMNREDRDEAIIDCLEAAYDLGFKTAVGSSAPKRPRQRKPA